MDTNYLIPPINNLIKYNSPRRLTEHDGAKAQQGLKKHIRSKTDESSSKQKRLATLLSSRTVEETEEILNFIMPPLRYEINGDMFIQEISSSPATRPDVINLQIELDKRLECRQAKLTGICPIRRELYSQVFDELIREITINCAERGLLLLRVRNEINMTLAAYQSVYESGIVFGLQKTLNTEEEKQKKRAEIESLKSEITAMKNQVEIEKLNCQAMEDKENAKLQVIIKKAEEDINFLSRNRDQYKSQLDDILNQYKQ